MSLLFQADADLNPEIGRGLRRRQPAIDFQSAKGVIRDRTSDLVVLKIASDANRVLVTRDIRTMPGYFKEFVEAHHSPGVLLIPSRRPIGSVIEGLLIIWLTWSVEDLQNQLRWIP